MWSLVDMLKLNSEQDFETKELLKKKMLSSDPFYKAVLIKESKKKSAVNNFLEDNDNDSD